MEHGHFVEAGGHRVLKQLLFLVEKVLSGQGVLRIAAQQ